MRMAAQESADKFWAFDSFGEFLAMGNHGFYVWLAYGLTFMVLGLLAWQSFAGHARLRREIAAQVRRNTLSTPNKTSGAQ